MPGIPCTVFLVIEYVDCKEYYFTFPFLCFFNPNWGGATVLLFPDLTVIKYTNRFLFDENQIRLDTRHK